MIVFSGSTPPSFRRFPDEDSVFREATTDGNIFPPYALPSALGMIFGVPPSMYAPRSSWCRGRFRYLSHSFHLFPHDNDVSGRKTLHGAVAFEDHLFDHTVCMVDRDLLDAVHHIWVEHQALRRDFLEPGFSKLFRRLSRTIRCLRLSPLQSHGSVQLIDHWRSRVISAS